MCQGIDFLRICIGGPQAKHWKGLLHRKCIAVAAVVGHETGAAVTFDTSDESGMAGIVSPDHQNKGACSKKKLVPERS